MALAAWGLVGFGLVPSLQYCVVSLAGPGRDLPATLPASAINAGIAAAGALVGGWAVANNGASAAVTTGLVICVIVLHATWATRFLKVPAADNGVETVASAVAEAAPSNVTRRDERSLMTSSTPTVDRPPLAGTKGENVILLSMAPVDAARRTGNDRHPLWSFVISVMCAMALTVGCSSPAEDQPSSSSSSVAGTEQDQVGQHASDNPGSVNTFWLETSQGLVIVDGQRTLSDARRALAAIQDTGQPVVAILITHAHPDHVGGLGVLHEAYPQTPIYASEATLATMQADPLGFYALTREQLGDDYPAELTYPDQLFRPEETLEVGGVRLETAEFGPAESEAATVYYEPNTGTLFSGDLINNQATPALLEGHTCGWLNDLDRLRDTFPDARTIYPGHGSPGDPNELMDQQWTYLESFRGLVRPAVSASSPAGESVSPDEQASIIEELERLYPGYQSVASLPTLLEENVAAVARELLAEDTANLPPACRGS